MSIIDLERAVSEALSHCEGEYDVDEIVSDLWKDDLTADSPEFWDTVMRHELTEDEQARRALEAEFERGAPNWSTRQNASTTGTSMIAGSCHPPVGKLSTRCTGCARRPVSYAPRLRRRAASQSSYARRKYAASNALCS